MTGPAPTPKAETAGARSRDRRIAVNRPIGTSADTVLRFVLGKLGISARLIPGFAAMYPDYLQVLRRDVQDGIDMATADARKYKEKRFKITYFVSGENVVRYIDAYLASIGRVPPKPPPPTQARTPGGSTAPGVVGGKPNGSSNGTLNGTGTLQDRALGDVFERVYRQAQTQLTQLINSLDLVLIEFGCMDSAGGRPKFQEKFRQMLVNIYTDGVGISVSGTTNKHKAMVAAVVLGLGGTEYLATQIDYHASRLTADRLVVSPIDAKGDEFFLKIHIDAMHSRGVQLRGRLLSMLADIAEPYDKSRALDQACTLLQQFPDVAQSVYAAAGLQGIASFPPQAAGPLNADAETFKAAAEDWDASETRWGWFTMGGLIIAGIAITVISAGTLTPLAATLVGVGIGLGSGVATVMGAENELRFQMDAAAFGGASPERIEFAQGEVQGAYAGLVVNVLTMGALARFGGGTATPLLGKLLRITAVSGLGGGLTTATQPNVWKSPNVGGMILWGTVMGAVIGAAGTGLGLGMSRLAAGSRVQIAIPRGQGPLQTGKPVLVQLSPNERPVQAVVTKIANDTVTLRIGGSNVNVKVARAATLEGDIFDPALQRRATRVVDARDFEQRPVIGGYTDVKGKLVPGRVTKRPDGRFDFKPDSGGPTSVQQRQTVRVYSVKEHARLLRIPPKDLEALIPVSENFSLHKAPGTRGFYLAVPRNGSGRLSLIAGRSRDGNGALKGWEEQATPQIDMRGQGQVPANEEIALFGAHGNQFSFGGISTRTAARTLADAIVTLNEMQLGRGGPIKAIELSSCSQGSRRFLFLGKTNAEAMQQHLDQRIAELGYREQHKITVLAADRMGVLYGVDEVSFAGNRQKTVFVPAGKQRPLAYQADVQRANAALMLVGVVLANGTAATGGAVVVGVAALGGPDKAWAWIRQNASRVLGWIIDETPDATNR